MTKQAYEFCFCYRRMFKLKMAEPPEDVVNIFNKYSDNGLMSIERLHHFLVDFQGEEKATYDHAQNIFNSLKHLHVFQRKGLHLDDFFKYLFGDLNPPLAPLGVILLSLNSSLFLFVVCFCVHSRWSYIFEVFSVLDCHDLYQGSTCLLQR